MTGNNPNEEERNLKNQFNFFRIVVLLRKLNLKNTIRERMKNITLKKFKVISCKSVRKARAQNELRLLSSPQKNLASDYQMMG